MLIFSLLFLSKFTCTTLVLIPYHLQTKECKQEKSKGIAREESDDEDLNNRIMAKILARKNAEKL